MDFNHCDMYNHLLTRKCSCGGAAEMIIDFVADFCRDHIHGIRAIKPEASFLMWLDCRSLGIDADALNRLFIHKAHLGLNRGDMFGAAGAGFMRFNIATQRSVLTQALQNRAKAINELQSECISR